MRSFLLHAMDDAGFDARLNVALDLAEAFDGHLTLFQAIPYNVIVAADPYGLSMADVTEAARDNAAAFRERIEARLQGKGVRWDWVDDLGASAPNMVEHAVLADLVIVGASNPAGGDGPSQLAGSLAINCQAPVLVVPDDASGFDPASPAVLFWNGSPESARALRAATPLLARASSVTLVQVTGSQKRDEDVLPASSGAQYLDRHGISCEVVEIPRGDEQVDEVLQTAALSRHAGYAVMGAYGKPRLFETVFGGVTQGMLAKPKFPVLLAH